MINIFNQVIVYLKHIQFVTELLHVFYLFHLCLVDKNAWH